MKEALVATRWDELAARLGIIKPGHAFRWLQARYAERGRKYHTAKHINECLAILDRSNHPDSVSPFVEFALWFHDAVYSTFSRHNEERSAEYADRVLQRSGRSTSDRGLVRELILATRQAVQPGSPPAQLVADVDLAIGRATFRWTARF